MPDRHLIFRADTDIKEYTLRHWYICRYTHIFCSGRSDLVIKHMWLRLLDTSQVHSKLFCLRMTSVHGIQQLCWEFTIINDLKHHILHFKLLKKRFSSWHISDNIWVDTSVGQYQQIMTDWSIGFTKSSFTSHLLSWWHLDSLVHWWRQWGPSSNWSGPFEVRLSCETQPDKVILSAESGLSQTFRYWHVCCLIFKLMWKKKH